MVADREQLERKHWQYAAASEPPPYIAAAAYLSFVIGFARCSVGPSLRPATASVAIGAGARVAPTIKESAGKRKGKGSTTATPQAKSVPDPVRSLTGRWNWRWN